MAQPATNAKIEELRFKVKTDPKSRLFYPLAEELRKAGQVGEAEGVLRQGLTVHATYLSAWVSLGRVLRDQKKDTEAVEALSKALQLDPGNVVAARLLADAYLALGEKIEAIKKYKLVHALLPSDETLKEQIEALDRDIKSTEAPAPAPVEVDEEEAGGTPAEPLAGDAGAPSDFGDDTAVNAPMPTMESPFGEALQAADDEARRDVETGDAEPMLLAHEESPFEEPASDYSSAAMTIEAPSGFQIESAPLAAEMAEPLFEDEPLPESPTEEADVFEPSTHAEPVHAADDVSTTLTMADLYARQGLTDDARQIYESILTRDPDNAAVGAKLAALDRSRTVRKLENWLGKVSRKEVGRV